MFCKVLATTEIATHRERLVNLALAIGIIAEHEQITVKTGDDLYVKITRAFLPAGWKPPILRPVSEVEGFSLLQRRATKQSLSKGSSLKTHAADPSGTAASKGNTHLIRLVVWFLEEKSQGVPGFPLHYD